MLKTKKKERKEKQYIISSYYYVAGEPDDSGLSIEGVYSSLDEAKMEMKQLAENRLQEFKNEYEEDRKEDEEKRGDEQGEDNEQVTDNNFIVPPREFHIKYNLYSAEVGRKNHHMHYGGSDGGGDYEIFEIHEL